MSNSTEKWTRRTMLGAAGAILPISVISQDNKRSPSDLNRVAVGTSAPGFTLPDASGKPHSLAEFRGKPAVLVFYRGYW